MRYFVVEDGTDVSAYGSRESAMRAIEPGDVPRMKLFDEVGNEYPLSVCRKQARFMMIWPTTIDSTVAGSEPRQAGPELKNILNAYAVRAGVAIPSDASLEALVEAIASYQGVLRDA